MYLSHESLELMLTKYNMFIHYFQDHLTPKSLKRAHENETNGEYICV
jgi:hypothetical protein